MPAVGERDGVGAGIWIRQICRREPAPRFTRILRPSLGDNALLRAAKRFERAVAVDQNTRLDGVEPRAFADRFGFAPGDTGIGRTLKMHQPAVLVSLGATRCQPRAVGQFDGLVFDRTEHPVGQASRRAPGFSRIRRRHHHAPPRARRRAHFVEQHERPGFRLKQNGVPRGQSGADRLDPVGHLDGGQPPAAFMARHPDTDIGIALSGATKPSGHQSPRCYFHDRGRMTGGIRRVGVDEARREQGDRGGCRP